MNLCHIIKDWIREPQNADPESRVENQKSVFVRPPDGFVEPDIVIVIPKDLKRSLLNYIEKEFDISTEKVYNDLYGFIRGQVSRLDTYKECRKGINAQKNGEKTDNAEEKNRHDQDSVKHFTNAIQQSPESAEVYNGRGLTYLSTGELDNALADFNKAIELNQRWEWISLLHFGTIIEIPQRLSRNIKLNCQRISLHSSAKVSGIVTP